MNTGSAKMMKLYQKYRSPEKVELTNFSEIFDHSTYSLRLIGIYPMRHRKQFWNVYFGAIMTMMWFLSALIFYTIYLNFKNKYYGDAAKQGVIAITMITITTKSIVILFRRSTVRSLIEKIDRDYFKANTLDAEESNIIKDHVWRALYVIDLWKFVGVATGFLFIGKPLILMMISALNDKVFVPTMILEIYIPLCDANKYEMYIFLPMFILSSFYTFFAACFYMGFDPLVPTFILHACGQMELVKLKIERLFPLETDIDDLRYIDDQIVRELHKIIHRLQEIYAFCEEIRETFTILYELVIKLTTLLLPVTAFQILTDLMNGQLPLEFMMFGGGAFIHFLVPSYYGDMLIQVSTSVATSFYFCGWERVWRRRAGTILRFAMLRALRPLALRTAFQVISLQLFAEMCHNSWTIFSVMLATLK